MVYRAKLAYTTMILIAAMWLADRFFSFLNYPLDWVVGAGILGLMGIFIITPTGICLIWRKNNAKVAKSGGGAISTP